MGRHRSGSHVLAKPLRPRWRSPGRVVAFLCAGTIVGWTLASATIARVPTTTEPAPAVAVTRAAAVPVVAEDAALYTITDDDAFTPELAAFLSRLQATGVTVTTTSDTAVLDQVRALCRDRARPSDVGRAFELSATQAMAAHVVITTSCFPR